MGASCFMGLGFFLVQGEASKIYPMHGVPHRPIHGSPRSPMNGSLGGGMYGVWRPSLWSSFTFDLVGGLFSEMERGKFRP